MKRSSRTVRRASMAANSFSARSRPSPSRSASFVVERLSRAAKSEDVGRRLDQTVVVEGLDVLLAEALDIEGVARHEMLQALDPLRRADQPAGAAPDRILLAGDRVDLAHRMAAAGRADVGKGESFRALGPLLLNHAENLRDHVAGPLDDHGVADADVLARDLILIVQRRVLHHDAADGDRLELGHRRQRAGAARPGYRCRAGSWSPSRPGICGRWRSAASARRSRGAPADRAGRACRRRRRCRSRGRRGRSRSRR